MLLKDFLKEVKDLPPNTEIELNISMSQTCTCGPGEYCYCGDIEAKRDITQLSFYPDKKKVKKILIYG